MLCNYRAFNVYFGQYEDVKSSSRFHMYRILTLVTWLVDVLSGGLRYRPQLTGQESGLWSHGKYSTGLCSVNNIGCLAWYKISGCVSKATCWNWSNELSIAGFPQFWFSLGLLQVMSFEHQEVPTDWFSRSKDKLHSGQFVLYWHVM